MGRLEGLTNAEVQDGCGGADRHQPADGPATSAYLFIPTVALFAKDMFNYACS